MTKLFFFTVLSVCLLAACVQQEGKDESQQTTFMNKLKKSEQDLADKIAKLEESMKEMSEEAKAEVEESVKELKREQKNVEKMMKKAEKATKEELNDLEKEWSALEKNIKGHFSDAKDKVNNWLDGLKK